jgi:hypothetical protein
MPCRLALLFRSYPVRNGLVRAPCWCNSGSFLGILGRHLYRNPRPLAPAPRAGAGRDGRSASAAPGARSGSAALPPREAL